MTTQSETEVKATQQEALDAMLTDWATSTETEVSPNLVSKGINLLPALGTHLTQDLPIQELERYEEVFKAVLANILKDGPVDGDSARRLAQFQNEIGFLDKYKSYTIKAATPLGYSIFLQEQGEGFSYQQHPDHKIEGFHILKKKPGGFMFICSLNEWQEVYDKERFAKWLDGTPDEAYDKFRYDPEPGDMLIMDQTGIVHTVVGCELQEFATVSTDMVDRLYDQNAGKPIPSKYNRQYAINEINQITFPTHARNVYRDENGWHAEPISPEPIKGGQMLRLAHIGDAIATQLTVDPQQKTDIMHDTINCAEIYIANGNGKLILADDTEMKGSNLPTIEAKKGNLFFIPAGSHYGFINESSDPFILTQHQIPLEVAFHQ